MNNSFEYEIKTKLNNGFTFVLDFALNPDDMADRMTTWRHYYKSLGLDVVISAVPAKNDKNFWEYNKKARSMYGKAYEFLNIEQKSSVIELYLEDKQNESC